MTTSTTPYSNNSRNENFYPLHGQVALVTGGARGIGRAVAIRLAERGAKVAICDIADQIQSIPYPLATKEELENSKLAIDEVGVGSMAFEVDIRNRKSMAKMIEEIQAKWKRLDILVANAGVTDMGNFEETMKTSWDDVIDVNLNGTANSLSVVLPLMKNQNYGRIVCISSQVAKRGNSAMSAYVSSKWGILELSQSVALEFASYNITCNAVCPTSTNTGMLNNEFILEKLMPANPTIEALDRKMSAGPFSTGILPPTKVADSVEFLCFPQTINISGTEIDVTSFHSSQYEY